MQAIGYVDKDSDECCFTYLFCALCCWWYGGCCMLGMLLRDEIRRKYNLPQEPCHYFWVHLFCHPCALCQETRYLYTRYKDYYD